MQEVQAVLQDIVTKFQNGDIPDCVAYATFPIPDIPAKKWSFLNRTIMFMSGTMDARGFRQWQQAGRFVRKGSRCFYILAPMIVRKNEEEVVKGFKSVAVFRAEDTDGQPLEYQTHQLPELPLMERAQEWGVNVKAVPGNYQYYGFFSQTRNEIGLATPDECVFFHELSHAGHCRIVGGLKPGQDPMQEVVAELCGAALCRLVGKSGGKYFGNAYRYIGRYAEKLKVTPVAACLRALRECELTLQLILAP
jgi:hypothetical protein